MHTEAPATAAAAAAAAGDNGDPAKEPLLWETT